jgi:hypothetical protein
MKNRDKLFGGNSLSSEDENGIKAGFSDLKYKF